MKRLISLIASFVFPTKCIFCGGIIKDSPMRICAECINTIKFNKRYCIFCGEKLDTIYGPKLCFDCHSIKKPYDRVFVPLIYDGSVRKAIIRFKYKDRISYAKTFSILIFTELKNYGYIPDAVTFVPIHFLRKLRRGYNQTELIAKEIANLLSVPCIPLLKKTRYTAKLAGLSGKERHKTVKNSFGIKKDNYSYTFENLLLVDDIITTSSTVTECSLILKKEYGCNISVAAIASTQKRKI